MVVIPFSGYRNLEKGVTHLSLGKLEEVLRGQPLMYSLLTEYGGGPCWDSQQYSLFIPRGPQFCQPMDIIEVVHY